MARLILTALMIWTLGFAATDCGSAKVPGPQAREASGDTSRDESSAPPVVLTDKQPKASWGVALGKVARDTEVLEVAITRVVNPKLTPIEIYVYLANNEKGKTQPVRHLVGNFSLYPPDQPGNFLLDAAPALRKISAEVASSKSDNVRLEFEMKRVDETKDWTPVELMIGQPKWSAHKK